MAMDQAANPWVVRESGGGVPAGSYAAKFVGVEDFTHQKIDGTRWKWLFEIVGGPHAGKRADALTERDISPSKASGRIVAGLLGGGPIVPGQDVKGGIDAAVGKTFFITVGPGPKGSQAMAVRHVGAIPVM